MSWLLEPLQYAFMLRGLAAGVLVGIVCAVVGTYVVLRGMAFFGDALAHTVLPGVALGYLVSGGARAPLFWWALGAGGPAALGRAIISTVRSYAVDLSPFLFGDVLGVTNRDLWLTAIFGGIVLLLVFIF